MASEEELLETFRPIDRDQVQLPMRMEYPFLIRNYMSWIEPSGHRTYLVFRDEVTGRPMGIVFERTRTPADAPAAMCQWCHSVRTGGAVTLMTASVSKSRRIGVPLCADLSCKENVSAPGVNDVRESLSSEDRQIRILQRMTEFARGNLF